MVQLGLTDKFRHKFLEWDNTVEQIKEPGNLLDKPNITKRDVQEVVIKTKELV